MKTPQFKKRKREKEKHAGRYNGLNVFPKDHIETSTAVEYLKVRPVCHEGSVFISGLDVIIAREGVVTNVWSPSSSLTLSFSLHFSHGKRQS